jgi:hypothetical protein
MRKKNLQVKRLTRYGIDSLIDFLCDLRSAPSHISQIGEDVARLGLSLIVIADWYNEDMLAAIKFTDQNTRSPWFPETGGANLPALNDLMHQWGIAFGSTVLDGQFAFTNSSTLDLHSATSIAKFPAGGLLFHTLLVDALQDTLHRAHVVRDAAVLGFYKPSVHNDNCGRIIVFSDSSCFEDTADGTKGSSETRKTFSKALLDFACLNALDNAFEQRGKILDEPYSKGALPKRVPGSTLHLYSKVRSASQAQVECIRCVPIPVATIRAKPDAPIKISNNNLASLPPVDVLTLHHSDPRLVQITLPVSTYVLVASVTATLAVFIALLRYIWWLKAAAVSSKARRGVSQPKVHAGRP